MSPCCSSARSTGACRSPSARACGTRAAPSSARARSASRSTRSDRGRAARRPCLPPLRGRRSSSPTSARARRWSSPPAARRRSGMRSDEIIVQEREGPATPPADAVVVVRSAEPQQGRTKAFLAGLYGGLARSGVPAVGTEASGTSPSAIPAFALAGPLHCRLGRHLGGPAGARAAARWREPGSYGVGETADDGVLPPIPPAPAAGLSERLSVAHGPRRRARRGGPDRPRRSRRFASSSPTPRSWSPTTARATRPPRSPRRPAHA